MKLVARLLEEPWGQMGAPHLKDSGIGNRSGEVRYEHPRGVSLPVMIKYLHTSGQLSIQAHSKDAEVPAIVTIPDTSTALQTRSSAKQGSLTFRRSGPAFQACLSDTHLH